MYYSKKYESPLGTMTLASDGEHLVGAWFEGQKYFGAKIASQLQPKADLPVFTDAVTWLDNYFAGERPSPFALPLKPMGTQFQLEVWDLLCQIPYGQVTTYGTLAKMVADEMDIPRMSSQAVGGAVGHNPLTIFVPCHRVVGKDGSLTGYAGGIDRKVWLLKMEGVNMTGLYVPEKGTAL